MKLDEIVKGLAKKHTGGKPFFDELDQCLMCEDIYEKLYAMVSNPHRYVFVTTGKFGMQFYRWLERSKSRYAGIILFPGGLRDGMVRPHQLLRLSDPDNWTSRVVFVDDSFYSGTTRATCLHQLYVPKTIESFVAYDGSIDRPGWLHSLYRWHEVPVDNYPQGGSRGVTASTGLPEGAR